MTTGHCPLCGAVGNRIFPTSLIDAIPGAITPERARALLHMGEMYIFPLLKQEEGQHLKQVQLNLPVGHGLLEALLLIDWFQA
jgi:hypothetical protein